VTTPTQAGGRTARFPYLGALICVPLGLASLVANVVWNCNTCGWDLDGVPLHEAFLVAAVPFVFGPLGSLVLGIRALLLRTRAAFIDFAGATLGLALPWLYFIFASRSA
jgi:hypothetical protein